MSYEDFEIDMPPSEDRDRSIFERLLELLGPTEAEAGWIPRKLPGMPRRNIEGVNFAELGARLESPRLQPGRQLKLPLMNEPPRKPAYIPIPKHIGIEDRVEPVMPDVDPFKPLPVSRTPEGKVIDPYANRTDNIVRPPLSYEYVPVNRMERIEGSEGLPLRQRVRPTSKVDRNWTGEVDTYNPLDAKGSSGEAYLKYINQKDHDRQVADLLKSAGVDVDSYGNIKSVPDELELATEPAEGWNLDDQLKRLATQTYGKPSSVLDEAPRITSGDPTRIMLDKVSSGKRAPKLTPEDSYGSSQDVAESNIDWWDDLYEQNFGKPADESPFGDTIPPEVEDVNVVHGVSKALKNAPLRKDYIPTLEHQVDKKLKGTSWFNEGIRESDSTRGELNLNQLHGKYIPTAEWDQPQFKDFNSPLVKEANYNDYLDKLLDPSKKRKLSTSTGDKPSTYDPSVKPTTIIDRIKKGRDVELTKLYQSAVGGDKEALLKLRSQLDDINPELAPSLLDDPKRNIIDSPIKKAALSTSTKSSASTSTTKHPTARIVSTKQPYHYRGMRAGSGSVNITNAKPGQAGALGNPFVAKDAGGPYTREEATRKFGEALRERVSKDPEFAAWIDSLRGKDIGYYKPDEEFIHLQELVKYLENTPPLKK